MKQDFDDDVENICPSKKFKMDDSNYLTLKLHIHDQTCSLDKIYLCMPAKLYNHFDQKIITTPYLDRTHLHVDSRLRSWWFEAFKCKMGPAGLGPLIGPFVVEGYINGPLSFEDRLKKRKITYPWTSILRRSQPGQIELGRAGRDGHEQATWIPVCSSPAD